MTEWQNPPRTSGFSVDPRSAPQLRPSDADRAYVDSTLRTARAEGRITDVELAERLDRTNVAVSLGELQALIGDVSMPTVAGPDSSRLPVTAAPSYVARPQPADLRRGVRFALPRAVATWIALALLFNLIWVLTGGPGSYYWPVWPMLGTGMPVIGLLISLVGGTPSTPTADPPSDLR